MNSARILFKSVRNLPKSDVVGSCDSFVVASIGSQRYQTKVIWNQYGGHWNEAWDFEFGPSNSSLQIDVYDKDLMYDEYIGSTTLNLEDMLLSDESCRSFDVKEEELLIYDKDQRPVRGYSGVETTIALAAYLVGTITTSPLAIHSTSRSETKPTKLRVTLKEVQHLPKMDLVGSCDAYAVARAGSHQVTA